LTSGPFKSCATVTTLSQKNRRPISMNSSSFSVHNERVRGTVTHGLNSFASVRWAALILNAHPTLEVFRRACECFRPSSELHWGCCCGHRCPCRRGRLTMGTVRSRIRSSMSCQIRTRSAELGSWQCGYARRVRCLSSVMEYAAEGEDLLNQAAHAAARSKGTHFQAVFRRLLPRLGYQSAVWAIAHRLCRLVWKILHEGIRYMEQGIESEPKLLIYRAKYLAKQLRKFGYNVQITPANGAPA
jgi:hypothetical protein